MRGLFLVLPAILLSPKRCSCPRRGRRTKSRFAQQVLLPRLLCYAQCASRLGRGISACRLWRLSTLSAPCESPTAKRGWTRFFSLAYLLKLASLPPSPRPQKIGWGKAKPCRRFQRKRLAGEPAPPNLLRACYFLGYKIVSEGK